MTEPLTDQQLATAEKAVTIFEHHSDTGIACCSAHPAAEVAAPFLAEVFRLRAALAEEESVSRDRGHWLAEVNAALIAAGQDEGGGYIAYARRITEVAAERDHLRAADAAVLAVMAYYRDAADDASRWAILSALAIARDGHIPQAIADHAPTAPCGATPVHQQDHPTR